MQKRAGHFGDIAVTDPSLRVRCEHASDCPGCPLIDLPYGEQLDAKRHAVLSSLSRFSELVRIDVSPTVGADPVVEYRRNSP
jgi:tRNA/tmRNA/rRNA uracil-C5-methylase (TrmA/RlmC/RlmD family)